MISAHRSLQSALLATIALLMQSTGCAHQPATPDRPDRPATQTASGVATERAPALNMPAEKGRVLLLEFTNFQCLFCARSQSTMEEISERYGDQVIVVTLHNPLPFHKFALPRAKLAVVAQRRDKLAVVKQELFEPYVEGVTEATVGALLKMSPEELKRELSAPETDALVEHQRRIANAVGLTGTPAFSINGHVLKGARPMESFAEIIDAEIALSKKAKAGGNAWFKSRFKENAPELHGYLFEGKEPPEVKAPTRKKSTGTDDTIYYVPVDHERDAVLGPRDAPVTVVSFIGFRCPFSKRFFETLKRLAAEFPEDVRIHIKHSPLKFHEYSRERAQLALCAREQGKFLEMADLLFENIRTYSPKKAGDLARKLRLNQRRLSECLKSGRTDAQLNDDQRVASEAFARGTPSTFVNGRKLSGARPFEDLKSLVDRELKGARERLKGTAPAELYATIIAGGERKRVVGEESYDLNRQGGSAPIRDGSAAASLKLTVFTDYQCPYCARIEPVLEAVKAHYGEGLAIEVRHFPLTHHEQAEPAARAAECANEAGRGLDMHRLLMKRQAELSEASWSAFAGELGLPLEAFDSCMKSERTKSVVAQDQAIAESANITGTPTLYVHIDGPTGGGRLFSPVDYSKEGIVRSLQNHLKPSPKSTQE